MWNVPLLKEAQAKAQQGWPAFLYKHTYLHKHPFLFQTPFDGKDHCG